MVVAVLNEVKDWIVVGLLYRQFYQVRVMKLWQWLEIGGAGLVLAGLAIELFLVSIQRHEQDTVDMILESRLTHLRHLIKTGEEKVSPTWEGIEEFYRGDDLPGDNHWQFQEVIEGLTPIVRSLFAIGAIMALLGKIIEFRESNEASGGSTGG